MGLMLLTSWLKIKKIKKNTEIFIFISFLLLFFYLFYFANYGGLARTLRSRAIAIEQLGLNLRLCSSCQQDHTPHMQKISKDLRSSGLTSM
jgi:hypothetical protein